MKSHGKQKTMYRGRGWIHDKGRDMVLVTFYFSSGWEGKHYDTHRSMHRWRLKSPRICLSGEMFPQGKNESPVHCRHRRWTTCSWCQKCFLSPEGMFRGVGGSQPGPWDLLAVLEHTPSAVDSTPRLLEHWPLPSSSLILRQPLWSISWMLDGPSTPCSIGPPKTPTRKQCKTHQGTFLSLAARTKPLLPSQKEVPLEQL